MGRIQKHDHFVSLETVTDNFQKPNINMTTGSRDPKIQDNWTPVKILNK